MKRKHILCVLLLTLCAALTLNLTSCLVTESKDKKAPTSSEIYEQAVQYVGEIVTYDRKNEPLSLGTGFVISSDGKIVTNYHVIEKAYSATICINEKTYDITSILAYDSDIDLAVLKINKTEMIYANLSLNSVNTGDYVYAIGSSRGMTNTYSQGMVTYANRVIDGVSYVQHDASITNGNSGGPLLNSFGEVIGINTWGILDSQNLNFAVSANELNKLEYGKPITFSDLHPQLTNVFDKLKEYVMINGRYNSKYNYFELYLGENYTSGGMKRSRKVLYALDDNIIMFQCIINDGEMIAGFWMNNNLGGLYDWMYIDIYNSKINGQLIAMNYKENNLLYVTDHNFGSSKLSMLESAKKLSANMIDYILNHFTNDFTDIDVLAEDIGFTNY